MAAAQAQYAPAALTEAPPLPSPHRPAAFRLPPMWPLAAALVLAVLSTGYLWQQNRVMRAAIGNEEQIVARLDAGGFRTAPFRGMSAGTQARVVYARDGSWYLVLVRGATRALHVAWMHDGTATMLGDARPHGATAMLYLPKSHRMERLALMDGGAVVAEAELAY